MTQPIRLGFTHRLVLNQREKPTEKDENGDWKPGAIVASGTLTYREPTSQQRNEYLAHATKLFKRSNSDDPDTAAKAVVELFDLRLDYSLAILEDVEGFEFPEGWEMKKAMREYGDQFLSQLARHVFEDEHFPIEREESADLGKSGSRSDSSRKAVSARSKKAAASG